MLHRFRELALTSEGGVSAAVEVCFKKAAHGIVTGAAIIRVCQECPCCLEPKEVLRWTSLRLFVVDSFAEADALGQDADPLIAPGAEGCN
ncbi:MAG: hypothetical protein J5I81_15140 [Nitrococcus mobilis]|nr:hypothetical protein [Nitrococcus mobilis]